jgi:hypothetical protein
MADDLPDDFIDSILARAADLDDAARYRLLQSRFMIGFEHIIDLDYLTWSKN